MIIEETIYRLSCDNKECDYSPTDWFQFSTAREMAEVHIENNKGMPNLNHQMTIATLVLLRYEDR